MGCPPPEPLEQIIERNAEDEDLKHLGGLSVLYRRVEAFGTYRVHIAHIASIDEATRLDERDSVAAGATFVISENLDHRGSLGMLESIHAQQIVLRCL